MPLMSLYRRMMRQADLVEQMIDTVGLRDALQERPDHANVLSRAASRCMMCDEPSACRRWLAEHDSADEAPPYCLNHAMFERLKRDIEAETSVQA